MEEMIIVETGTGLTPGPQELLPTNVLPAILKEVVTTVTEGGLNQCGCILPAGNCLILGLRELAFWIAMAATGVNPIVWGVTKKLGSLLNSLQKCVTIGFTR